MRMVIVEDETMIREGIIKLIKKVSEEHEVVGEAENGIQGLQIIEEKKPDLIITDIKMSDMDGLEMLERVKKKKIAVKAIVLSAYSEFSYAQQAIKLGVSEYLLKPIAIGDLTQSLKNIEIQLKQEPNHAEERLDVLQSLENVFYSVLFGGTIVDQELIDFLYNHYRLNESSNFILIQAYLGEMFQKQYKILSQKLQYILKEKKQKYCLLKIPQNNSMLIILFFYQSETALERWFQNRVLLQLNREKCWNVCFGWICCRGISMIKSSLYTLQKNMDWNIVLGDDVLVSYPKVTKIQTVPLSYPIDIENQMRVALCALEYKKAKKIVKSFCDYFKSGKLYSPNEIKECFVRFLWSMLNVLKEINFSQYENLEQQEFLKNIMTATSFTELEQTLEHLIVLLPKNENKESSNNLNVQKAKSLVHEFYDQGITLDEIALKLNITPEYLGSQFHKEIGINFSAYIKNFRIKKAKELLIGTRLKLYEIADKIGYGDAKYFSQVFRESTGMLPSEYRKMYK